MFYSFGARNTITSPVANAYANNLQLRVIRIGQRLCLLRLEF